MLVDVEIRSGIDIALLPIEFLVFLSCAERYYESKTMRMIEEFRSGLKSQNLEVEEIGKVLRIHVA